MRKICNYLIASILLILALGCGKPSYETRDNFASLIDQNAVFYLEIPNFKQLQEDWVNNPFYELLQREDLKEFIQALMKLLLEKMDVDDDTISPLQDEVSLELIKSLFQGQIALGVCLPDFETLIDPPSQSKESAENYFQPPDFWLILDHGNPDLQHELVEQLEKHEDEIIKYEDFNMVTSDILTLAFQGGIVLLTNSEETATRFIDRYQGENSQPTLGDSDNFQKGYIRFYEDSEVFYYLDLSFLEAFAETVVDATGAGYARMVEEGMLAPAEQVLEELGLDAFRAITGSMDMDPEVLKTRVLTVIQPNDGFFGKLTSHYGSSLPDTGFLGEDLKQAVVFNYSISDMIHDLEKTISAISPLAGRANKTWRDQSEQALGVQFDRSLIDNLSGSIYYLSGDTPNTSVDSSANQAQQVKLADWGSFLDQGSAFIFGINDRIALEALIDALLTRNDPQGSFQKTDYLGTSHYALSTPTPLPGPSLFVSDQYFMVEQNNPDFAKLVVSMMQNPGQTIFERQDVRDALNELPADPISLTYNDWEKMLYTISLNLRDVLDIITKNMPNARVSISEPINPERSSENSESELIHDLPETPVIEDFKYFSISTTYNKEDDDLYSESIIRPKMQ